MLYWRKYNLRPPGWVQGAREQGRTGADNSIQIRALVGFHGRPYRRTICRLNYLLAYPCGTGTRSNHTWVSYQVRKKSRWTPLHPTFKRRNLTRESALQGWHYAWMIRSAFYYDCASVHLLDFVSPERNIQRNRIHPCINTQ